MFANTTLKPFRLPKPLLLLALPLLPLLLVLISGCTPKDNLKACSINTLYGDPPTPQYIQTPLLSLDLHQVNNSTTHINGQLSQISPYATRHKISFWEKDKTQESSIILKSHADKSPINFTLPVSAGFDSLHIEWYAYKSMGLTRSSRSETSTTSVYRNALNSNYFIDALKDPNNSSDIFISYSQTKYLYSMDDYRGTLGVVGEALSKNLTFLPLNIEVTRDGIPLVFTNFSSDEDNYDNYDDANTMPDPIPCPNMNISRLRLNAVENCTQGYQYPPTHLTDYVGALMGRAVMLLSYNPQRSSVASIYNTIAASGFASNIVYMPSNKGRNLNLSEVTAEYDKLIAAGAEDPLFIYRYSAALENEHNYNNYTISHLYNDDGDVPNYIRGIKLDLSIAPESAEDFFMVDMDSKFVPTENGHKLYTFLKELKSHNLLVMRDLQIFGDYTAQIAQGTSTRYSILRPSVVNEYNLGVHAFLTTQPEHLTPIRNLLLASNTTAGYLLPPKYNVVNVSLIQSDERTGSGKIKVVYDNPPLAKKGDVVVVEVPAVDGIQTIQQPIVQGGTGGEILIDNLHDNHLYSVKIYTQKGTQTSLPLYLLASPAIPSPQRITHSVRDNDTILLNINLDNIDTLNVKKILVRPISDVNTFAQESKTLDISKRYTTLQAQIDSKKVFCYNITTNQIPVAIPRGHAQTMEIYLLSDNNVPSMPTTYRAANVLPTSVRMTDNPDEIDFNFTITSEELMGAELPLFDANTITIGLENIDIYQEGELGFDDTQEGAEGSLMDGN